MEYHAKYANEKELLITFLDFMIKSHLLKYFVFYRCICKLDENIHLLGH